jgi:diacylglycerol kinase family enzyme
MTPQRPAAVAALALAALAVAATVLFVSEDPWQAFATLLLAALALAAGAFAIVRRGPARVVGLLVAGLLAAGLVATLLDGRILERLVILGLYWAALAAATTAFLVHMPLPRLGPPRRPVVLINPRSGGGKATRLALADEARARGIDPVILEPADDLAALARAAADDGADALAMAGGDGSQAVVAEVAADRGLPFACIPAGTRNHFALDLGVDREDPVGALDALVDGGERVVDLGDVNGRVFVNNVSLGVYATAVQRDDYRGAKMRTLLEVLPEIAGPGGTPPDLTWTGPHGEDHPAGAVLLVSNNRYRLGGVLGAGTRPRMDEGRLGIAVVPSRVDARPPRSPLRQWSAARFEVRSAGPVPAGVDGEATTLVPPVRFRVRRSALRVRIAPSHPGASPSARQPASVGQGVRALLAIAAGRAPSRAS